jgi:hypothetical protein
MDMRNIGIVMIFCLIGSVGFSQNPQKLRRADSYWGLHFDTHSGPKDSLLGKTLTEGMIDTLLRLARPDFIQVDCKGHPGISSYPTLVGQQAVSYVKDPLALIRKVTESHNVSLYMHYSGVIDNNYVKLHPEEARFTPDGKSDGINTSLWGAYVDKLLIPQLKELNDKYHVDGVWIDGECWSLEPDYQPAAKAEFTKKTGITKIPESPDNPDFKAYLEFNRQKFVSYLDHYIKALHSHNPKFQICSNWAYSAMMPEPVSVDLDFLSGDLSPFNSLNTAAWQSRCLANQGKHWDLMSWSFTWDWRTKNQYRNPKTAIQLCQEGAEVISMGGGYQVYFKQNEDISMQPATFGVMKEVADFIIPRREFCFKTVPTSQIALLYSTAAWKNNTNSIYRDRDLESIQGILYALLDGQNPVDVTMTHTLMQKLNQYRVVVIPEWEFIEPDLKSKLSEYVKNGGNLLVIGAKATKQFDDLAGVKEQSAVAKSTYYLGYSDQLAHFISDYRLVGLTSKARLFASMYATTDLRFPVGPAATITDYGKGKIASIYTDLGESYKATNSPVTRNFLSAVIQEFIPSPIVGVKGSHKVHIVPAEKKGKLYINLVNTSGDHSNPNYAGFDEIPSLRNIEVSVKLEKKPQSVMLQPDGKTLKFDYINGKAVVIIPEIKIHTIVEILK